MTRVATELAIGVEQGRKGGLERELPGGREYRERVGTTMQKGANEA